MLKPLFALLCGASALCASDGIASGGIHVERDGPFWLVRVTGTLPVQSLSQVRAEGDLRVRGRAGNVHRYTVSARVNARNETEARTFAGSLATVRPTREGVVFGGPGSVDLEVPRHARSVSLVSQDGGIDAADLDGAVSAQTTAGRIALDRIGGDVEIRSSGGSTTLGRIGGLVRCYSGGGSIRAVRINGAALFETNGGEIVLGEVMGSVRAMTGGGGIRIDHAGSRVFAGTSGGQISVLRALGMVVAQSSAGPIEIGSAPSVECQSGGGTIRLNNMSGAMRAVTERGSVIAEVLAGSRMEESFLSTGAGDILVVVPSDMGVTVDAEMSGTRLPNAIVSDYPALRSVTGRTSVSARGAINGGGARLRLRASGGRIEIRRK